MAEVGVAIIKVKPHTFTNSVDDLSLTLVVKPYTKINPLIVRAACRTPEVSLRSPTQANVLIKELDTRHQGKLVLAL